MNPLVIVIGGVALLGAGYVAYKFTQAASPISQIETLATGAAGSVGSILSKDPISVTSVASDLKKAGSKLENTIEGWL